MALEAILLSVQAPEQNPSQTGQKTNRHNQTADKDRPFLKCLESWRKPDNEKTHNPRAFLQIPDIADARNFPGGFILPSHLFMMPSPQEPVIQFHGDSQEERTSCMPGAWMPAGPVNIPGSGSFMLSEISSPQKDIPGEMEFPQEVGELPGGSIQTRQGITQMQETENLRHFQANKTDAGVVLDKFPETHKMPSFHSVKKTTEAIPEKEMESPGNPMQTARVETEKPQFSREMIVSDGVKLPEEKSQVKIPTISPGSPVDAPLPDKPDSRRISLDVANEINTASRIIETTTGPEDSPAPDPAGRAITLTELPRQVQRVMERLWNDPKKGESRVELHLDPPHLGRVRVSLSIEKGVLHSQFTCSQEASNHLRQNIHQLRTDLASQGITLGQAGISDHSAGPERDSSHGSWQPPLPDSISDNEYTTANAGHAAGDNSNSRLSYLI